MTDESHDINYKMSKKIAQLTKVIYQLNCRNEDNDATIRSVAERYENEIAEIMSDAKNKITSLRDTLAAKNDKTQLEIIVKELTARHQKEKEEAMRMFEEYKTNTLRNEGNAKHKYEEGLLAASREVTSAKEQFTAALEAMRAQQKKSATSKDSELAELRQLKEKEMDDMVKEYNERYKAMMAEQMDAQDRMERELNAQWQSKLDALNKDKGGALNEIGAQLAQERANVKSLQQEKESLMTELAASKKLVAEHQLEIDRLRQKEIALSSGSSELGSELTKANELVDSLRNKIGHLEGKLSDSESLGQRLQQELDQLRLAYDRQVSEITNLENNINVLKANVAKLENELQEASRAQGALTQDSDSKLKEMKAKIASLEEKLSQAQIQIATSQASTAEAAASLGALKKELDDLKLKYDTDMQALKSKHEKELASATQNASSSTASLLDKHKAEIAALVAEHAKSLANAKQNSENEVASLKTKHNADLDASNAEASRKLKELHDTADKKYDALLRERNQLESKLSGDASTLQSELLALQNEVQKLRAQLEAQANEHAVAITNLQAEDEKRLTAALEDLRNSSQSSLSGAAKQHAEELDRLRKQLAAEASANESERRKLVSDHNASMALLKQQHENELAATLKSQGQDATARHNAELARVKKELSDQLERQRLSMEKEMADKVRELTTRMNLESQQAAARIKSLEEELAAARDQSSHNQQSLSNELNELKARMEANDKAHKAQLAETISKLTADAETKLAAVNDRYQSEKSSFERQIASLKQAHQESLDSISESARQAQKDLEDNHKNRLANLEKRKDEEQSKKLADLKQAYGEQLTALADTSTSQLKELRDANAKLNSEVSALSSTLTLTNQKLESTSRELANVADRLREAEEEALRQAKMHAAALSDLKRSMEIDRNQAIATVHSQHQAEAEMALATFETEKNDLNGKIKQLKRAIADLEYKYANRESRAEDVDKINALLRDLRAKDEALLKAYNDMKYYKLELENREESFNKMFGRQPVVASADSAKPVAPSSAPPPKTFGADLGPRSRVKSMK